MNCSGAVAAPLASTSVVKRKRPACRVAPDQCLQPGLVDRDAAGLEQLDLGLVHVQAQHVVAEVGQAGAGHEADIAGSDDGDFH